MVVPETIPTDNVILTSALLTGFVAYQSRVNGLETLWERERFLNRRLADKKVPSDTWEIRCENIEIEEKSGFLYRVKKFLTGGLSGTVYVTVSAANASFPDEMWGSENFVEPLNGLSFEITHKHTVNQVEPTRVTYVLETTNWGDIREFLNSIIRVERFRRQN